jgi:hypothetical protein
MAPASDPDLLVLHGLRLKSFAAADVVAAHAGLTIDDATARLEQFREKEWVRYREGALTGWMLLPAGRAEAARLLADELEATGARAEVDAAYRTFLSFNQSLLQVCTDWQLRPTDGSTELVTNDHSDAAYDANVIGALRALNGEVQPVCASLASMLDRFASYGPRLTHALDRTEAGEPDWFTKPTIDSYHTVWFELHENLLATLAIERGKEESA